MVGGRLGGIRAQPRTKGQGDEFATGRAAQPRAELYAFAEAYLDALVARDRGDGCRGPSVAFTENNVRLAARRRRLWNTTSARRDGTTTSRWPNPETGRVALVRRGRGARSARRSWPCGFGVAGSRIAEVETDRQLFRAMEFGPVPQHRDVFPRRAP